MHRSSKIKLHWKREKKKGTINKTPCFLWSQNIWIGRKATPLRLLEAEVI